VSSVPDHATDGGVPAPGPWMLGHSSEDVSQKIGSTGAGCWLCDVDSQPMVSALVLGLVLAMAVSWWVLRRLRQRQVVSSGLKDTLRSAGSKPCQLQEATIGTESSDTMRKLAGLRHKRGRRAAPQGVFQRPALARGILLNGSNGATQKRDTAHLGLRFAPTSEVRLFKRWQKPPSIKQSSPRNTQHAAFELTDPFGSLAQTQNGKSVGKCLAYQSVGDGVKDQTDMSYIFGATCDD
jgi:hypothetical protein